MKMTRILALVMALALVLAGCGQNQGTAAESSSAANSAQSDVSASPQDFSAWGAGSGSLQDYYACAAGRYPDALAGIAYLGTLPGPGQKDMVFYDMDTPGFFPFMFDEINPDAWQMSCTGCPILVWCIAPAAPDITLTVYEQISQDPMVTEKGAMTYQAQPGEPVLFLIDRDDPVLPFCAEATAPDGRTTLLAPEFDLNTERLVPALPQDGSAFDISIRPGEGLLWDWQLTRYDWWLFSQVADSEGSWLPLLHTLTFHPDGTLTLETTSEMDGSLYSLYSGSWKRTGPELFALDLALTEGTALAGADGTESKTFAGECTLRGGLDITLLVEAKTETGSEMTCFTAGASEEVNVVSRHEPMNRHPQVHLMKHALLEYLRQEQQRPEIPLEWKVLLRRCDVNSWLFEVFDQEGTVPQPTHWYLMDPSTLQGTDLADGSLVDINDAVQVILQDMDLLNLICVVHNAPLFSNQPEKDVWPADFARISSTDGPTIQVDLFSSTCTGMFPLESYIINRDTGETYAAYADAPVVFNVFDGPDVLDQNPEPQELPSEDYLIDLALNYCEGSTGYRPASAMTEDNGDGTITVRLFDDMGDHIATSAIYTIDPLLLTGFDDLTGEPINLNNIAVG